MFWGCGIGGILVVPVFGWSWAESLRASTAGLSPPISTSPSGCVWSMRPARVGVRISLFACDFCAFCSCNERAKACGSDTAAALSSASAFISRLLFSRCSWRSDIAERKAMASGFSLSEMATEGGCCLKLAVGGGAGRGRDSVGSVGASCAIEAVGVMGDTGGRSGEAEAECLPERSEAVEASLEEGRGAAGVLVSTRSAGMAATRGLEVEAQGPAVVLRVMAK